MIRDFGLVMELYIFCSQTIDEVIIENEVFHISIKEKPETYIVCDCYQEYYDWWVKNHSCEDDFWYEDVHEYEDNSVSTQKRLKDNVEILTIELFYEFARWASNTYVVKNELSGLKINLGLLIQQLNEFKNLDKNNLPQDLRSKCNTILLICRNIGILS